MKTDNEYDQELDYEAFLGALPDLMVKHKGQIVVFHDNKCIKFFDAMYDAVEYGNQKYGEGLFIAQEVIREEPSVISYSLAV